MSILEFYRKQQQYKEWYNKFQSTGKNKSGKVFSHTSTTYRNILNFLSDLDKFKGNNGISRIEWEKYSDNGQEKDKQRPLPLTNANIIAKDIDRYYLTNIGYTCIDLLDGEYTNDEKWILLYIILLNYRFEERKNDLLLTTKEMFEYLSDSDISIDNLLNDLKNIQKITKLEELFRTDIFWYITFAKDKQFITKYKNSSSDDKEMLHMYVINEQKNKKSKDLIGHKFVSSGSMSKSTFLEECEILLYTYNIMQKKYKNLEELVSEIIKNYESVHGKLNEQKIMMFIKNHRSVYQHIFEQTGLRRDLNE